MGTIFRSESMSDGPETHFQTPKNQKQTRTNTDKIIEQIVIRLLLLLLVIVPVVVFVAVAAVCVVAGSLC